MGLKRLPTRIFEKVENLPKNSIVYTSSKRNDYLFVGFRKEEDSNAAIIYTVPNTKSKNSPYRKIIKRKDMDSAWKELITKNKISRKWIDKYLNSMTIHGPCYFCVFFGIINILYPNIFRKERGVILKI